VDIQKTMAGEAIPSNAGNEARFCKHCGKPLSTGALFCEECGKEVADLKER
jgi:predicted amidophosphoribosyltransferase